MTDEQLLKLYATQPQKAFRKIVQLNSEKLYWFIRKIVIRHADTDDILQNTFLKAWKSFSKFKGRSAISTWLFSIARNEAFTFLKKAKRYQSNEDVFQLLEAERSAGYFSGERAEIYLQQAIQQLPDRQKEVFVFRYYNELTYDEIVAVLGGTKGSHKASYHHAVKKVEEFVVAALNQEAFL